MDEEYLPPYKALIAILEACPSAIHAYYELWKNQDRFQVEVHYDDVEEEYLTPLPIFRIYLFDLCRLDLLSFQLGSVSIKIKLYPIEPDDLIDAEGLTLC